MTRLALRLAAAPRHGFARDVRGRPARHRADRLVRHPGRDRHRPDVGRRPGDADHHGRRRRRLGRADRAVLGRRRRSASPSPSATSRSACCAPSAPPRARPGGWSGPRRCWSPSSPPLSARSLPRSAGGPCSRCCATAGWSPTPSSTAAGAASLATAVLVVLVSLVGVRHRRAAGRPAARPPSRPSEGRAGAGRMRWWRVVAAVLLIGYGVAMGVVTVTVTAHDPTTRTPRCRPPARARSWSASGWPALAPWLLRWLSALARPALGAGRGGPPGGVQHPPPRAPARRGARAGRSCSPRPPPAR